MFGTGEEVQQPEQLIEQGQVDEVLKASHEQLQLTIKEIEREMDSGLGNTLLTFESSTLEAGGKLGEIQVHCNVEIREMYESKLIRLPQCTYHTYTYHILTCVLKMNCFQ